jgi:hypothetical protein
MKKSILILSCFALTVAAYAQKNSVLVMGNINLSSSKDEPTPVSSARRTYTSFTPGVGYQFTDRWTVGVLGEITLTGQKTTAPNTKTTKGQIRQYGGGLFARYNIPITDLLFLVTQADAAYTTSSGFVDGVKLPGSGTNFLSVEFTPSIGMNIKKGYALNLGFGNINFQHGKMISGGGTNSAVNFNLGRSFTFGITKNFMCNKHKTKATTTEQ